MKSFLYIYYKVTLIYIVVIKLTICPVTVMESGQYGQPFYTIHYLTLWLPHRCDNYKNVLTSNSVHLLLTGNYMLI